MDMRAMSAPKKPPANSNERTRPDIITPGGKDGAGIARAVLYSVGQIASQKIADQFCDFRSMRFQNEVAGINHVFFSIGQIAQIGRCALGRKYVIVLTPDNQRRGLILTKIILKVKF